MHLPRPLGVLLAALYVCAMAVMVMRLVQAGDLLTGIIAGVILGLAGFLLVYVTSLVIWPMLCQSPRTAAMFICLAALAVIASAGLHGIPDDPGVAMWAMISYPFTSGLACTLVVGLAAAWAAILRIRDWRGERRVH